jgi:uncharacterized membrane protein
MWFNTCFLRCAENSWKSLNWPWKWNEIKKIRSVKYSEFNKRSRNQLNFKLSKLSYNQGIYSNVFFIYIILVSINCFNKLYIKYTLCFIWTCHAWLSLFVDNSSINKNVFQQNKMEDPPFRTTRCLNRLFRICCCGSAKLAAKKWRIDGTIFIPTPLKGLFAHTAPPPTVV